MRITNDHQLLAAAPLQQTRQTGKALESQQKDPLPEQKNRKHTGPPGA